MSAIDWAPGELTPLPIPAHIEALREAGTGFLTDAFRATGALGATNRVNAITQFQELRGGGTGRKLLLSVAYERPEPGLPTDLFVKFSRDFDDERRDTSRYMMESEVRFAMLSRMEGFPITVARCFYADFDPNSGTGILITERIGYGKGAVERHYGKCLDYVMPEPLAHYEALVRALARLAGTHKAGHLTEAFYAKFPFDAAAAVASDRIRYTAEQLEKRVARIAEFAERCPQLLPQTVREPGFLARLGKEAPLFLAHEAAIRRFLFGNPDLIALCHWNANVDNAWFSRNERGVLECGLLDWGRAGQMNVAQAIYGALSGAEPTIWDEHLGDLLALFLREFRFSGGPEIDPAELKRHLQLTTATMGLAYIMDAPALIQKHMPDAAQAAGPHDPRFRANEDARVWLHMLTMFLNQWRTQDFGALPGDFRAV
jgi:hypothetical protein